MLSNSEHKIHEMLKQYGFEIDTNLISEKVKIEIELLLKLNKITKKHTLSSKIYLSMLLCEHLSIQSIKIRWYSFIGILLGYRI